MNLDLKFKESKATYDKSDADVIIYIDANEVLELIYLRNDELLRHCKIRYTFINIIGLRIWNTNGKNICNLILWNIIL